jgi:hypothetical protein
MAEDPALEILIMTLWAIPRNWNSERSPEKPENPNQWAFLPDIYSLLYYFDFLIVYFGVQTVQYFTLQALPLLPFPNRPTLNIALFFIIFFTFFFQITLRDRRKFIELWRSVTFRPFQSAQSVLFPLLTFSHFSKPPVFMYFSFLLLFFSFLFFFFF